MTDIDMIRNMMNGNKININNQILKIKRIEVFENDLGEEDWRMIYLDEGYNLSVDNNKINFFKIIELEEGDELLEDIKIEKLEEVIEEI